MAKTKTKKGLVAEIVLAVRSKGLRTALRALNGMIRRIGELRRNLFMLGVSTIFVDRLIQSFVRAWKLLNTVLGIGRVAKASQEFLRLAKFTGVGTRTLQAFTAVAQEVGAELNDVADLLSTVAERVDDLRSGQEKGLTEDFARFGLSAKDFAGANNPFAQFLVIADRLDALDPQRALAMAEKILGGDLARKFGQLIDGGRQGLKELMQEAVETGEILSDAELKRAAAFERARLRLSRVFTAFSNQLASTLIPPLHTAFGLISDIAFKTAKFLKGFNGVRTFLRQTLDPFFNRVEVFLREWEARVKPIGETVARLAMGVVGLLGMLYGPRAVGALGFFRTMATWAGKLVIWVEDVMTFLRGGKSVFGTYLRSSTILQELVLGLALAWTMVKDALSNLKKSLGIFTTGPLGPLAIKVMVQGIVALAASFWVVTKAVQGMTVFLSAALELMIQLQEVWGAIVNSGNAFGLPSPITATQTLTRIPGELSKAISPTERTRTTNRDQLGRPLASYADSTNNVTFNFNGGNQPGLLQGVLGANSRLGMILGGS